MKNYQENLKQELENNPVWIALRSKVKPEELLQVDEAVASLLSLATGAINGFSNKISQSNFTEEELASAIKDKTGAK